MRFFTANPEEMRFASVFLVSVLFCYLSRAIAFRAKPVKKDLLDLIRVPSHFWILIVSLLIALSTVELPAKIDRTVDRALTVLLLISITLTSVRLAVLWFHRRIRYAVSELPMLGLTQGLAISGIYLVSALILLNVLGINITPVLTAFGLGGLAIALALQDTLSNLFAGVTLMLSKQIRIGERIKMDTGQEGYVVDIGWRFTTIRDPANHNVVVPNAKVSQAIITSFEPELPVNVSVPVLVGLNADPEKVEKILRREAEKAIKEMPDFVKGFTPAIRFEGMVNLAYRFVVILQVENFNAQSDAVGELNKRFFKRLEEEGVGIRAYDFKKTLA